MTDEPTRGRPNALGSAAILASGSYEFAGLVAVHDEQRWIEYGGELRGSWETDGVRRYSSRDHDGIARLIRDDRWCNEGLFAFLQALRRLAEIAPDRVTAPTIAKDHGVNVTTPPPAGVGVLFATSADRPAQVTARLPTICDGCGSHRKVYSPGFKVTVQVTVSVPGTEVASSTPGPLSRKL